jgi:hypothetical protein
VIAARNWTPSSTSLAWSTTKTSSSSTTRVTLVVARTVVRRGMSSPSHPLE